MPSLRGSPAIDAGDSEPAFHQLDACRQRYHQSRADLEQQSRHILPLEQAVGRACTTGKIPHSDARLPAGV